MNLDVEKRFLRGKKDFWLYAVTTYVFYALTSLIAASVDVSDYIINTVLLFLLYQGYIWVWYYNAVIWGITMVYLLYETIAMIPDMRWMLQACPQNILYMVMMLATAIVGNVFLTFRKNLKCFVKSKQQKRKGK